MKSKIIKTLSIIAIISSMIFSTANAATTGATATANKNTAKAGETVEVSIALSVESCAYDIKATTSGSVSTSTVETAIQGSVTKEQDGAQRIYLVQQAEEENRTIYPVGTKIATIKYTISPDAKAGDKLVINISGDIVGKTSSERNEMNQTVTITIEGETNTNTNTNTTTNTNTSSGTNGSLSTNTNTNATKTDKTTASTKIPQTGVTTYAIVVLMVAGIVVAVISYIKYRNIK